MSHKALRTAFVVCSLSCVLTSSACAGLRVGVTGGPGVGHMSINSKFDEVKWSGGASLEVPVGHRVGVRSGVFWRPNGSKLGTPIPEYISTTLRFNYIAVPLGAYYQLYANSRLKLLGLGAMEWSYLIDAHQVIDQRDSGETESEVTDQMQDWDLAPVLGIALATAGGFELAVQHSWGLRSVYKDFGDLKNRSLWILGTLWVDFP